MLSLNVNSIIDLEKPIVNTFNNVRKSADLESTFFIILCDTIMFKIKFTIINITISININVFTVLENLFSVIESNINIINIKSIIKILTPCFLLFAILPKIHLL